MSLVYRAIWQDDLDSVCTIAAEVFSSWVRKQKSDLIEVPTAGTVSIQARVSGEIVDIEVLTERASAVSGDVAEVYRAQLIESRPNGQRWHTTLRTWQESSEKAGSSGAAWVWVDVEVVGDVDIRSLSPKAPILARNLLQSGKNPRVGHDILQAQPRITLGKDGGEELAEELSRFDRTLPFVVLHNDGNNTSKYCRGSYTFGQILQATAKAVAGVANVVSVDTPAAQALTDALTASHGLWGGALRIYVNDLDPATPTDAWRHRYITADRYLTSRFTAPDIAGRTIGPISSVRRPPHSFNAAKALLDQSAADSSTDTELLEYADAQLRSAEETNAGLLEQLRQLDEDSQAQALDLEEAIEDRLEAIARAEKLSRQVDFLEKQLAAFDQHNPFFDAASTSAPSTAANLSHAAELAREHLSDRVVIPDDALRDLTVLDGTVNAGAWGDLSWLAFRSLHAYSTDCSQGWDRGGFYEWCSQSGHPMAWRASVKKLAMSESQTVKNNQKLRQCRVLPVSTDVDPTGRIFMESHIKIATGGGNLAPRIYFHFDSATQTMHVGFFGPHKYMPNTRT